MTNDEKQSKAEKKDINFNLFTVQLRNTSEQHPLFYLKTADTLEDTPV